MLQKHELGILKIPGLLGAPQVNKILSYIGTIENITEQKRAEETIYQQAHFDHLTSLANRFLILNTLEIFSTWVEPFGRVVLIFCRPLVKASGCVLRR